MNRRGLRAAYLLSALLLAGCAGRPVHDLAQRAGGIEIAAVTAEQIAPASAHDHQAQVAGVAAAGGAGAAAGLTCGPVAVVCSPLFGLLAAGTVGANYVIQNLLDKTAATRTRALADRMLGSDVSVSFVADIASRLRQDPGGEVRGAGPAMQLDLAVSRLELQPRFADHAQLLVWIEARLHCAESPCDAREARQRYVHVGDEIELRDMESNPELFPRYIALAQQQLAWKIRRDLRR